MQGKFSQNTQSSFNKCLRIFENISRNFVRQIVQQCSLRFIDVNQCTVKCNTILNLHLILYLLAFELRKRKSFYINIS